jgi:hypothetical protein
MNKRKRKIHSQLSDVLVLFVLSANAATIVKRFHRDHKLLKCQLLLRKVDVSFQYVCGKYIRGFGAGWDVTLRIFFNFNKFLNKFKSFNYKIIFSQLFSTLFFVLKLKSINQKPS